VSLIGCCLIWNVAITNSVGNVKSFASGTNSTGPRILPARKQNDSFLGRWLNATVSDFVSGPEYSGMVG
jgi:hypothetical protein